VVNKTRELSADLLVIGELKEVVSRREIFYDEGERIFRESPCPVVVVKNPEEVERAYKEIEQ
jgi:nucleotide-binding universal stress UspA family protein